MRLSLSCWLIDKPMERCRRVQQQQSLRWPPMIIAQLARVIGTRPPIGPGRARCVASATIPFALAQHARLAVRPHDERNADGSHYGTWWTDGDGHGRCRSSPGEKPIDFSMHQLNERNRARWSR